MGRPPTDPSTHTVLFNCRLKRPTIARLKEIVRLLSIHGGKRVSEGAFITQRIEEFPMPPKPTKKQIAAFENPEGPPK